MEDINRLKNKPVTLRRGKTASLLLAFVIFLSLFTVAPMEVRANGGIFIPTGSSLTLTVSPSAIILSSPGSVQLTAYDGITNVTSNVSWSSSNPAAVSVSTSGAVQALASGSAVVTASSNGAIAYAVIVNGGESEFVSAVGIVKTSSLAGLVGTPLTLMGAVLPASPAAATVGIITWSLDMDVALTTASGAALAANGNITVSGAGDVVVSATVVNGVLNGTTFSNTTPQGFTITFTEPSQPPEPPPVFVAVTGITGVPSAGTVGVPLTLTSTVLPTNATNRTIVWSLGTGSTAPGATVDNGVASASGTGTVVVTATIINALIGGGSFIESFTINFQTPSVPATDITLETTAGQVNVPFDLNELAVIHPENAYPNRNNTPIVWTVTNHTIPETEREFINGVLTVWTEGMMTVRGRVPANADGSVFLERTFVLTFSNGAVDAEFIGLDELFVGVPAAGEVRFSLRSAVLLPEIFEQDFRVSGLPAGLQAGTPRRVSDTLVIVPITGTPARANENASSLTVPSNLPARNVLRGGQPLGITPMSFPLPPIIPSATLRQQRAVFDLNPDNPALHRDIQITLNANDHPLRAIMYGNYRLIEGVDFTLTADNGFRIHGHFLRQLPIGEWPLTFDMRQGASPDFTLAIIDTRIPTREEPQPGPELDTHLLNPPPLNDMMIFMLNSPPVRLDTLGLENGSGIIRPVVQGGRASFWLRTDILEYLAWRYPAATIEAQTRLGTLRFPTFLLDILRGAKAAIAEERLEYDQVYVRITLTDMSQNQAYTARVQSTMPGAQVLAPLVDVNIELIRRSDMHVFFTVREFTRPLEWIQPIMPPSGILRYGAFWFNDAASGLDFAPHRSHGGSEVMIRSIYTGTHGIINNPAVITDVAFSNWGFASANTAAQKGLVRPAGGVLSPTEAITRAEFARLLSLALQLPSSGFIPHFYHDVPVSHEAYDAIARARYAGLLDGEEAFRPNVLITRQEMISIIAQAISRGTPVIPPQNRPLDQYFTDYRDIGTRYVLAAQTALNHGIFVGFEDATFRPDAATSRMEAVSMLVRLMRVMGNID